MAGRNIPCVWIAVVCIGDRIEAVYKWNSRPCCSSGHPGMECCTILCCSSLTLALQFIVTLYLRENNGQRQHVSCWNATACRTYIHPPNNAHKRISGLFHIWSSSTPSFLVYIYSAHAKHQTLIILLLRLFKVSSCPQFFLFNSCYLPITLTCHKRTSVVFLCLRRARRHCATVQLLRGAIWARGYSDTMHHYRPGENYHTIQYNTIQYNMIC